MIIEIDGIGKVEVSDEFADLTPTEQNNFVESIRAEVERGSASSQEAERPAETQRTRAFMQGVTLGFADELEAAIRNPMSALGSALGLSEGKSYKENLDTIRKKLESYKVANPIEALAAEMAGAGVSISLDLLGGAAQFISGEYGEGAKNFARNLPFARMWFWKDEMNQLTNAFKSFGRY